MSKITQQTERRGRPATNQATVKLVTRLYNEDEMTCEEIAMACNISKSTLFRILREWKIEKERN